ncbi:MAG: hypothetical protein ACREOI_20860 [bacterium]
MENLMERVRKVLRKEFLSKELLLQNTSGGMVGGWIISDSFDGLDVMKRQQRVWKLFDAYLNEKDRNLILGFHTFTPLEKKMAFDDDFDEVDGPARKKSSSLGKNATAARHSRNGAKRKYAVAR